MNDYDRIAKIINFIDAEYVEQPNLEQLAELVGLSIHHFHRLFSRWAGVTPKAFLRCLTVSHAKQLLKSGMNVLDTSYDLGLSSPGRLHDLCVNLEAASPGELQSGGRDWTIRHGLVDSPFGRVIIGESQRGICHLSFTEETSDEDACRILQEDWPNAVLHRDDAYASNLAGQIFRISEATKQRNSIKAFVIGTPMQVKVWRALLQIPSGNLTSYGELATSIDHPRAARAAGSAVGANPLAYLIPCHRVIRKTGAIGGYRWRLQRKRAIIACESAGQQGQGLFTAELPLVVREQSD